MKPKRGSAPVARIEHAAPDDGCSKKGNEMKIEVHHKADEGEGFVHVANVEVPDNTEHWRVLEYAYRWTNNINGSWSIKEREFGAHPNSDFNERVEVVAPLKTNTDGKPWGHRSSMIGDIFVAEGKRYRVATFGFEPVNAPRDALRKAVNRAIENGAPVYVNQPAIDWDDPEARLALLERVGADEYNRLMAEHHRNSVVETINGHGIRPVRSRFGRLFMVGDTGTAFLTLEQAREFANKEPAK